MIHLKIENKIIDFHIFHLQTLNGKNDATTGGAIIFITDGKQFDNNRDQCADPNELWLHNTTVINRVIKTKVRIITVAFG